MNHCCDMNNDGKYENATNRRREHQKKYYLKNKERLSIVNKLYRNANKEKLKEQKRQYCLKNKDRIAARAKNYREIHKKEKQEKDRMYRQKNRERVLKQKRQYYLINKKSILEGFRQYRQKNKEILRANNKEYRTNNKEKIRQKNKEYRLKNLDKIKKRDDLYRLKNKNRIKAVNKEYAIKNKEKIKKIKKEYRLKNKEHSNYIEVQRRKNNLNVRILHNLRGRVSSALKGKHKSDTTLVLIGCTIIDFRTHIEKQFKENMSWDNYGKGDGKWNVDHIIPCSIFEFEDFSEQKQCFHFTNLRPLWERGKNGNFEKHNKTNGLKLLYNNSTIFI